MIKTIRVPKQRVAVVIGERGKTKRTLEKEIKVKVSIEDQDIIIEGDALDVMTAENIVKAIGRGFSPEKAFLLKDENNVLFVIPLPENRNTLKRVKSRLIGTKGKCRKNIERLTDTFISIYGKTVSVLGPFERAERAIIAVEKIISGSPHSHVYKYLENSRGRK
jgi:ribosomal RNA assembly protein